ncbi:MAG TPA: hypothetical protein VGM20_01065 [Gemmatimonadales bacterium]|jgi:hypothetical protein
MRRALYLVAALVCGAVFTASAQAHARISAHLDLRSPNAPSLLIHVDDLFTDPTWLGALDKAYTIQLHWRVQLWRQSFFRDQPRSPVEWDVVMQKVPITDVYKYAERVRTGISRSFASLDSLRDLVGSDVSIPTPATLAAGSWYYTIDATLTAVDQQRAGDPGGITGFIQRAILGTGPKVDLSRATTVTFTVPDH